MVRTYTLAQVQEHNRKDDVWIVVHNKVYDITKYLEEHPGGSPVLLEVAGTDATEAFEETGHSEEARELLEDFYIGDLPSQEHAEGVEIYRPNFEAVPQVAAVIPVKRTQRSLARVFKTLVKLGLLGALSTVAYTGYRRGFSFLAEDSFKRYLKWLKLSNRESSSYFWSGFGIATAAQASLTVGLGLWVSTKLDVQQEFTRYEPYRTARPAMVMSKEPGKPVKPVRVPPLDPQKWRKFKLSRKDLVSPNVYRFVFALPNEDDILGLPTGQHIALRATIQGQTVARSYTPVSNNTDLGRIELIVKVYPNGMMTKHLESMEVGDEIEIRGPKGAMQYSKTYAKNIGMIAGGTGITPMYQLIRAICDDPSDQTQISLLYANNTEEDILLRDELDAFAKRWPQKFKVHYVLSQPSEKWDGSEGFVTADLIKQHLAPASKDSKVLLCGPPPMINAMKKNLAGLGFQEPGALSKVTDQVFLF
ncbi:hypothetical protein VTN02DRAFT_2148 [Thermoascus thermophilus]